MLFYFVIFCIIGFCIGYVLKDSKIAIALIIVITLFWALVFGPWAFVTFFELIIGYVAAKSVRTQRETSDDTNLVSSENKKTTLQSNRKSTKILRHSNGKEFPAPTSGAKIYTNSIGMKFILIPAGTFQRDAGNEENPILNGLKVTVSKPFYLGIYPVTQEQWEAVMGNTPAGNGRRCWQYDNLTPHATAENGWVAWKEAVGWGNPSWFIGQNNPVDSVPWEDTQEFISRLNSMENHHRYRLPTNMEWELAAKGGTHTKFFLGEDERLLEDYAWVPDNADNMTHPVGQKMPNPYGLYDIYGNVSEWVQDWQGDFPMGEVRDYTGPSSGEHHVSRGGRTLSAGEFCAINDLDPKFWNYIQGFRVAFSVKNTPEMLRTSASWVDTLESLPEALRTPEFYLNAVRTNGKALASVPKTLRTLNLCLAAVQSNVSTYWNSSAFEYVPEELKTPEMCLIAVQSNGRALEYVPEELKTSELCLAAVQAEGSVFWSGTVLEYVPKILKTPELYLAAVQCNGWMLNYTPKEFKTTELCLEAVQSNGSALRCVPEELKALDICMAAVQSNGRALEYVPDELKTLEICLNAVQDDESALEYVPEDLKPPVALLATALSESVGSDDFIPDVDFEDGNREYDECSFKRDEGDRWWEISDDHIPYDEFVPYDEFEDENSEVLKTSESCLTADQLNDSRLRNEESKIIREIETRKIRYLVHFTSGKNLESIFSRGFIPIADLENAKIPYKFNDDKRLDVRRDCTCFSIEYPNHFLFDIFKKRNPSYAPWCVLELNIIKLFEEHSGKRYYTVLNAASNSHPTLCRNHLQNNPDSLSTYKAFEDMFQEKNPDTRSNQQYTRTEKKLKNYLPTNPQSEVLITGKISKNYIDKIYFNSQQDFNEFKNELQDITILKKFSFECNSFYFKSRDIVKWENR